MKDVEDIYELSPMQQGMLFHTLYDPASGVYVEQSVCTLDVDLDASSLKRAWQRAVERHAALRTAFHWKELDKPLQVMHCHVELPWEEHDWRQLSLAEQQKRLEDCLKADSTRGFDLAVAPLMRLTLIRIAEKTYWVIWTFHHILIDGWCAAIILQEVLAFYDAFCQGQDLHLPTPRPYRDYILWLQQQNLSKAETFWRETLKGFATPTPLGVDGRPGGLPDQINKDGEQRAWLSAATTTALNSFARRNRLTLNTLVQGAWALLLSRYSGERDIVFGATVSGRPPALPGVESMVGLFINTLPMRVWVPPGATLLPWLKEIQARQTEMRQYEYTPLVEVQRWSDVPRGTPLFESFLVFENYPIDKSLSNRLGGNVRFVGKTNYPLGVGVSPGTELSLRISYDRRRFDDAAIARMLGHFQTLLEGIVADPDQRLSALPLLTERERRQLSGRGNLVRLANPFIEFTQEEIEQSIPDRSEQQVRRYSNKIAVKTKNHELTYVELNAAANRLAETILTLCGSGEGRVALLLEHDAPMLVGILGILKAGKTYVPLDPFYPKERITYMLEDSQAGAILTNNTNLSFAKELAQGTHRLINMDDIDPLAFADNLDLSISPDTLAYILYTSGSIGQPKGVMQNHRNVLHHIRNYTNNLHINSDDRLTLFSSYSFDAAVMDIFGALLNGATLYPVDIREEGLADLSKRLLEGEITIYHSTPTVYRHFISTLTGKEEFPKIRLIVLGGEEVNKRDVDLYKRHFSSECIFINGLGPTESTVSLQYFADKQTEVRRDSVPVGYPVEDTEVALLDEAGEETAIYGEIGIKSHHIALGYWQKPELTRATFLPSPQDDGKRLYRTGDMGRYLSDGSIEFAGRKDSQVKLRGYRIELGEIEARLLDLTAIKEAVVVLREDGPGDSSSSLESNRRLVAYVVATDGQKPTVSEMRCFLGERLPGYMVPSVFVMMDALPLTPTGKVDRRALPAPDQARPELAEGFVAPRTPTEETLAGIWAEVLGVKQVGVYDNFFELGGHSLLATQVMSRVHHAFQIELPLRYLFEAPTVANLAKSIETIRWTAQVLQASFTTHGERREEEAL